MPLGADNPHGVGWFGVETELETEQGAIREVDPRASRFWKIKNKNSRLPTTGAHSRHVVPANVTVAADSYLSLAALAHLTLFN